jgi:hypothetical protein
MSNNISGAQYSRNIQANQSQGTKFGKLSNINNHNEKSKDLTKQDNDSIKLDISRNAQRLLQNEQFRLCDKGTVLNLGEQEPKLYLGDKEPILDLPKFLSNPETSNLKFAEAQYYKLLFDVSTDEANKIFGPTYAVNGYGNARNTDLAVARYNELRDQVKNEFSHDKDLLEANLNALDEGFKRHLNSLAGLEAGRLYMSQVRSEAEKRGTPSPIIANHPLAQHKDFNHYEFFENTKEMFKSFAEQYIKQVNDNNGDYMSALNNTLTILNSMETTSVNNLSLNDYKLLEASLFYDNEEPSMSAYNQARNDAHNAFLSNPNLSDNLKKILGINY